MRTIQFIFLLTIPFLIACDGNTDYEWIIQNNTDGLIIAEAVVKGSDERITKTVEQNEDITIALNGSLGGSSVQYEPAEMFERLIIQKENGEESLKDYMMMSSWEAIIEQTNKMPSNYQHTYILTVETIHF